MLRVLKFTMQTNAVAVQGGRERRDGEVRFEIKGSVCSVKDDVTDVAHALLEVVVRLGLLGHGALTVSTCRGCSYNHRHYENF